MSKVSKRPFVAERIGRLFGEALIYIFPPKWGAHLMAALLRVSREFKQIATAGTTTAVVTKKV